MSGAVQARVVEAGRGWAWIVEGFALFRRNPLIWVVLFLVLFLLSVVISMVPRLGQAVLYLLSPVFAAGWMTGCRALEDGHELEIAHLFSGFRGNVSQLITVGGVYLVGQILILGVIILMGGGPVFSAMLTGEPLDPAALEAADTGRLMFYLLVAMGLSVPLIMAIWFAPLLVTFDELPAVEAMKLSFAACMGNVLPFLIYGAALFVLGIVAFIPLGLGVLVLVPVIFCSIYTSYKDVFRAPHAA